MNGVAAKPVATDDRSSRAAVWGTVSLIAGILLSLVGFGILSAGAAGAFHGFGQDDEGFLATPTETFATDAYALTTKPASFIMDRGAAEVPFDVATVKLQASSTTDSSIFIGVGPVDDVERYLDGVSRAEVRDLNYFPFRAEYRDVAGTEAPAPPTDQDFWAQSASGTGIQEIEWMIEPGNWTAVVMNADGSEGVSAEIAAGVRSDLFAPAAAALIVGGLILLLIGLPLLVLGAIGLGRSILRAPGAAAAVAARTERVHPATLVGAMDPGLSRWLWLVKWILAIPHFLILFFLWFAFVVCTVAAGFAILFTGRYPRSLFEFNVGVLRWSWRVGFYSYGALGTDKYPPFSLAPANYHAEFSVDYPERLSNGLVLVKWWLLAIPHYLVLAAVGGVVVWGPFDWEFDNGNGFGQDGISLLAALVLIAAVILLFTAKYPGALFDLVIGINRWAYRVITYAALMRDEYPPFRLDQGALEPARLSDLPSEALEQP